MTDTAGNLFPSPDTRNLAGGSGGAIPIVRGVLMAPSGVILHLSGNDIANGNDVSPTLPAAAGASPATQTLGRFGSSTGSITVENEQFALILNGHKGTDLYPNMITGSFVLDVPNADGSGTEINSLYISEVFNTDPKKIEQAGHLLYAHYDIPTAYAQVTGSGIIQPGLTSRGNEKAEDVAFILTSSLGRKVSSSTVPDYESFEDRFQHATSPYVISQKYGGAHMNLFRVVALSAGSDANTRFRIRIGDIERSDATKYPTFSLSVYDFTTGETKLESFSGLTLDPSSPGFIGRVIGNQRFYYDFDKNELDQKIQVTGDFPVNSQYIRLDLSS